MKKNIFKIWIMALPMLLGLAACAEHDNPTDPNPLAKQVSGLWWTLIDYEGEIHGQDFTRMGMAYQLNEDGTGYGVTFFFNDEESDPIDLMGGESWAPLTYTTTLDGRITADFGNAYDEYGDYYKQFTVTYADGTVTATNGQRTLTLTHPSEAMAVMIRDWDLAINGGLSPTSFNANTDFTASTWRTEKWIYIYDGVGDDHPTKNGFTIVALPWNTEHSEGTLQTNLPDGFCNDITPENGWELALNVCGKSTGGVKNNNFFALYNKYLGILRFFYFMPADFASGNDHVWQVSMSDNLAQHSLYGYGVPSDRSITDKAAIGQTGADTYMEYVTPWVDYLSSDGLVTPNGGWWAFDVDLSMYRANANHNQANIKLQMRSWDKHTTSLYSALTANIDGTIKANLKLDQVPNKSSSTAKGVLMGLQAAAQAGSSIANFVSGNWAGALTSMGQMFGTGSSLAGLGGGGPTNYTGSLDGTISLGMNGNINTSGVIDGSKTITGIPSPTLSLSDFDLKNSHIGQGVWNVKTVPVVYWATKRIAWHQYKGKGAEFWCQYLPYFFDPSSIEIELNPNIFPDSEIEWVEVNAICGARAGMQPANAALYAAYGGGGLLSKTYVPWGNQYYMSYMSDYGQNDCLWDFLYANNDKYGMQELYTVYTEENSDQPDWPGPVFTWQEKTQGRGADGYAIEPQVLGGSEMSLIPFLEVNVTVRVKMKGMQQPIVLSRSYLPEIKDYGNGAEFAASAKKTRPYASKMNGHTDLYDYQMQRISDIIDRYSLPTPSNIYPGYNYIPLRGTGGTGGEGYDKLFDGKKETKWCTSEKQDGKWFVEFMSREPINVNSYYLTTANDTKTYPGRNPKKWKVYGKLSEGDQWTELDNRTEWSELPADNYKKEGFGCSHMKCQYFRFEVSELVSGDVMQLSEFEFNAK